MTSRPPLVAQDFVAALLECRSPAELPTLQKRLGPGDDAFGIRMRDLFDTARRASAMPLEQVERLFASDLYEVRMGAVCILDFRAKAPRVPTAERLRLYELYLGHHDQISTWDMVDRAAPAVVGGHLLGRSVAPLHDLAASGDPLRRRTAVTAPCGSPATAHLRPSLTRSPSPRSWQLTLTPWSTSPSGFCSSTSADATRTLSPRS